MMSGNMWTEPLSVPWIAAASAISLVGLWMILSPKTIPEVLATTFVYGKMGDHLKSWSLVKLIQVPKRWFLYFYIYAAIQNIIMMVITWRLYLGHHVVPSILIKFLDAAAPSRTATVSTLSMFLTMLFITLHTSRRVYECIYVSVYSGGNMNLLHFLVGLMFYCGVTTSALAEAPGFMTSTGFNKLYNLDLFQLKWHHVAGTLLYVFAIYHHHTSHVILANLRRDSKGKVVTTKHLIPEGGLFEYVSCPHYFAEVLIYLALWMVLGFDHKRWCLVLTWVLACQFVTAILTHKWYLKKHKNYPKDRFAIIPFIF